MHKTRKAYYTNEATGYLYCMGDTVEQALEANMTVKDYEKRLIELNPQLDITIKIEPMTGGGEK